jgi:hypothetical protein
MFLADLDLRFGTRPPGVEPEIDAVEGPPLQLAGGNENGDVDERTAPAREEDGRVDPRFRAASEQPPPKRARFESFGPGEQAQWWAQNFAEDVEEAPTTSNTVQPAAAAPESGGPGFLNYPAVAPQGWRPGFPPRGPNFQPFQRGHFPPRPQRFPGNRGGFRRF